ncbi:MAG: ATP-binding protein [Promethearchaeia archaeon]
MRKENEILKTMINNTPILMAYLDEDFNFIRVNRAYAEADEKKISFFPGKNHFDLYPNEENEKIFQKVVNRGEAFFIRGKPFMYPENPERGVTYWDWSLIPVKDSKKEGKGLVFTLNDVTKREIARQKLKQSNKDLNFYKDLLAHDMRNILMVIQSSTELLKMGQQKSNFSINIADLLEKIKEQVEHGVSLISNVQKLSYAERKNREIKTVKLQPIVNEAVSYIRNRFKEKNTVIKKDFPTNPIRVKGGKLLLDAFENILINGVTHNNRDNIKLWIAISQVKVDGKDFVKIEFKDNAGGIPDEDKEKIFKRSVKSTNSNGMGIGLTLVKEIIEGYDGRVWVENRIPDDQPKGSNFILLLQAA